MSRTRRTLVITGGAALIVLDVATNRTGHHGSLGTWTLVAVLGEGAVYVGTGLVAMTKRPDSRVGLLMCSAGFILLLQWIGLSNAAFPFTIATVWFTPLATAVIAQIILTFPSGRMGDWTDRVLVGAGYLLALVVQPSIGLFLDPRTAYCPACPRDLILVRFDPQLANAISTLDTWLAAAVAFAIVFVLARRWWMATPAGRRVSSIPLFVGLALTVEFIVVSFLSLSFFGVAFLPSNPQTFLVIDAVLTAAYPVAFLIGLLRTRMARSSVGDLVIELGRGSVASAAIRDALADRLGDPSLELVYRVDATGGWVDRDGRPATMPEDDTGRAVTLLERQGDPIAAMIHDVSLLHDPELLEAVASAARLAVANERLQAEVRAQLELVTESRARIVEAADEERRRIERNLHDGAQQRLVTLSLSLAMAAELVDERADPELGRLLKDADEDARRAIAELRELARGIHPAILTNAGLRPALRSLANRSSVPVRLERVTARRLAPQVEGTAYYAVAEALTNVAKHAGATSSTVRATASNGILVVEIADDGVGGANPQGSGLRGLADRVTALAGTMSVESPPGGGTRIHVRIPCA